MGDKLSKLLTGCCSDLAYNLGVPTPFYHLNVAKEILLHPDLPEALSVRLGKFRSAFVFGHTAPDVQTVSGQARDATHFFKLPISEGDLPAWENMLSQYPALGSPEILPAEKAAFVAGYLCHLQADWLWVLEIFVPVFGIQQTWATFKERLYYHNVLRAYLDRKMLPGLSNGMYHSLESAVPVDWLPFVRDRHLQTWRDFLSEQLRPGHRTQTVEVFARRQGISPKAYYRLLNSDAEMERWVFSRLPRLKLDSFHTRLVAEQLGLVKAFFDGRLPFARSG